MIGHAPFLGQVPLREVAWKPAPQYRPSTFRNAIPIRPQSKLGQPEESSESNTPLWILLGALVALGLWFTVWPTLQAKGKARR